LFTGNSNLNRIKINKIAKKRISKKKRSKPNCSGTRGGGGGGASRITLIIQNYLII